MTYCAVLDFILSLYWLIGVYMMSETEGQERARDLHSCRWLPSRMRSRCAKPHTHCWWQQGEEEGRGIDRGADSRGGGFYVEFSPGYWDRAQRSWIFSSRFFFFFFVLQEMKTSVCFQSSPFWSMPTHFSSCTSLSYVERRTQRCPLCRQNMLQSVFLGSQANTEVSSWFASHTSVPL